MTGRQNEITGQIVSSLSLKSVDIPSFSQLARLAGLSKQALCRHFHSKEELLEGISEYLHQKEEKAEIELIKYAGAELSSLLTAFCVEDFSPIETAFLLDCRYSCFPDFFLSSAVTLEKACFCAGCWLDAPARNSIFRDSFPHSGLVRFVPDADQVISICDRILCENSQDRFYSAIASLAFKTPVTVNNISRELGVAPSTIYSHYPDKSSLLEHSCEEEIMRFITVLAEARYRIQTQEGMLLACFCITSRFVREGGILTRNLLLDESSGRLASGILLSPQELFITLVAVYCSEIDIREIIPFLERGIEP